MLQADLTIVIDPAKLEGLVQRLREELAFAVLEVADEEVSEYVRERLQAIALAFAGR